MKIKTRFAPSPTGNLHFGNIRTALFSWLFANKYKGSFILRIEDTDVCRNITGSVDNIIKVMKWLKLHWNEKVYFQSKRLNFYNSIIDMMLQSGTAYKCYCSEDTLKNKKNIQILHSKNTRYNRKCRNLENNIYTTKKSFVVRFKNPLNGYVKFYDEIRGIIKFKNSEIDDFIIRRRNGIPTYNFCVVVDDLDMKITHVIRGEDHISNTPKQINIFSALNVPHPKYAHLPILLDIDYKKISKKNSNFNVIEYFKEGFLPEAILNYLVRLGWSHGDQEIFSLEQMKNLFSFKNVSKSSSIFDKKKLLWLNKYYINNLPTKNLISLFKYYISKENIDIKNGPRIEEVFQIFKDRCNSLRNMAISCRYLYDNNLNFKKIFIKKFFSKFYLVTLNIIYLHFKKIDSWKSSHIWNSILLMSKLNKLSLKNIIEPLRIIFTGDIVSPSISKIIYLFGKHKTLFNIKMYILYLKKQFI